MNIETKIKRRWAVIILSLVTCVLGVTGYLQMRLAAGTLGDFQTATPAVKGIWSATGSRPPPTRVWDCIRAEEALSYAGSYQCVLGQVRSSMDVTSTGPAETTYRVVSFSHRAGTFFLVTEPDLEIPAVCVRVWGEIRLTDAGVPYMTIFQDEFGYINLAVVADWHCRP